MIGYIKPVRDELKVKHNKLYNSYYCTVCTKMNTKFGKLPLISLNHDSVFNYIFFTSIINDYNYSFLKKRCPINPLKKIDFIDDNKISNIFADLNYINILLKLFDNKFDKPNYFNKFIFHIFNKKNFHYLSKEFIDYFQKEKILYNKLKANNYSFDLFVEIINNFSTFYYTLLPFQYLPSDLRKLSKSIIINLIKLIFISDTIEDLPEDINKQQNNVLIGNKNNILKIDELQNFLYSQILIDLKSLNIQRNNELVENIIHFGLKDLLFRNYKLLDLYFNSKSDLKDINVKKFLKENNLI